MFATLMSTTLMSTTSLYIAQWWNVSLVNRRSLGQVAVGAEHYAVQMASRKLEEFAGPFAEAAA